MLSIVTKLNHRTKRSQYLPLLDELNLDRLGCEVWCLVLMVTSVKYQHDAASPPFRALDKVLSRAHILSLPSHAKGAVAYRQSGVFLKYA